MIKGMRSLYENIIESKSNELVTFRTLSDEEAKYYWALPCGIQQTQEMIRWVTVDKTGNKKSILEQTANGTNRIRVRNKW